MMTQPAKMDLKTMDRRVIERFQRKGLIQDKEVEAFHKTLPDTEPNAVFFPIPEPGAPSTDDGDDSEA